MSYCKTKLFCVFVLGCRVTDLQNHSLDNWSEHILLHLDWMEGHPNLGETKESRYKKGKRVSK